MTKRGRTAMERTTTYFAETGKGNTDRVLELARQAAQAAGIRRVVLASTRGYTAERAVAICPELDVVAVGIDRSSFDGELMGKLEGKGWPVIFSREAEYTHPREMQVAYRRFGQGTKVAVEVVVLAVMAGLVEEGERVIGVGGSSAGADTALLITASYDFSGVRISEVICKPL